MSCNAYNDYNYNYNYACRSNAKAMRCKMARAKKQEVIELTEEERLIIEAAELRTKLEPFRELERRYDEVRKTLRDIYLAGLQNGRNQPMTAPGWQVTFRAVDKPEYHVKARTEYHILFSRMISPSNAA
jgi:hypothetical protein